MAMPTMLQWHAVDPTVYACGETGCHAPVIDSGGQQYTTNE